MSDYDMAVIGSGFAGSAAALSFLETAEKTGRVGRVALVETGKNGTWPGGSRWAQPFLALDGDNKLASERGVERDDQRRRLEEETANTIEFMQDHNVNLIHQDEEDVALDFEEPHFVYLGSGGKEIVDYFLSPLISSENADILWEHEATGLTTDDGRVNGVIVRRPDGSSRTITADAVVLACGGFEGNPEMLREHLGEVELPLIARGLRYNHGDGIRMAVEVGADTTGEFDMAHAELVDTRAERYRATIWGVSYGIVVNESGERFHDEGEDYLFATSEAIAHDTWRNQNQRSYLITDGTVMDRFGESWLFDRNVEPPEQSDTIGDLARKLGLDPASLEATVSEFNEACGPGEWDPSRMDGKKTEGITPPKSNWSNPIETPPFYGFPMTAHLAFTFGGLKTDADGQVLNANDEPVGGLYAAGEITGLSSPKQALTTSMLRASTFGRLIGADVAGSLPEGAG